MPVSWRARGPGAAGVAGARRSGSSTTRSVWWPCRRGACGWQITTIIACACCINQRCISCQFPFFSAFSVIFKFSFSPCFPPFVFLSYHWCRWRPMYTKFSLYYTIFVIALRPLSSFLLFLTLLLNKIKCVLSFVSHVCFLSSGPLIFSLLPFTTTSH